jgi:hypothetical protein
MTWTLELPIAQGAGAHVPADHSPDPPVLPDTTSDERAEGWGDVSESDPDDLERFLRERPPHHGD